MLTLRPNSQSGFTLIEMLVVLSIMGLVAVLVTPNLTRKPSHLERAQVRGELLAKVQELKTQAAVTGALVRFEPETLNPDLHFRAASPLAGPGAAALFYPDGSASGGTFVKGDTPLAELDPLSSTVRPRAQ